ncbi:MAG: response regulator [Calditrichaeota bacterium]|nr:MAG: response regulator [Calditrichota bacterium]
MKKILLAEDDRNLSRSIDTWLTLEGFQVVTVYNGEEALNKLLQQSFDLLITDIAMPRLNGMELIEKIRRLNPDLPIMVVSGKLNPRLLENLRLMNVKYILSKPINPTEFRKMIGSVFPESYAT